MSDRLYQVFQTQDFKKKIRKPIGKPQLLEDAIKRRDELNNRYPWGYFFDLAQIISKGHYRPIEEKTNV